MRRFARFLALAGLIAGLGLAVLPAPLRAQVIEIPVNEAHQIAANAIFSQQYDLALQIAEGLLQLNPQDHQALSLKASALIGLGQLSDAAATARNAFRAADSDIQRVDAARLVASAHFRAKQYTRSEWWLRRALNNANDNAAQTAVHNDFAQVRRDNPLTVQLSFSAAPNNNINNGSSSETSVFYFAGIPLLGVLTPDARALSGTEVSGSVDLSYRISQASDRATDISLTLFARTFELSPQTRRVAPSVKSSDYSFGLAEVSLTHARNFAAFSGPTTFKLTLGENWYGGDPFTQYGRATLGQGLNFSENTGVDLSLGFEHQVSIRDGGVESQIYTLGADVNHRFGNSDLLGLGLQLAQTNSDNPTAENTSVRASASYTFAKPILGMQVSLNMAAEQRDFDLSVYAVDGRHDLTLSAGARVVFLNASYFGFSPSLSLETSKTNSNVGVFNRESVALRFGVQSAF